MISVGQLPLMGARPGRTAQAHRAHPAHESTVLMPCMLGAARCWRRGKRGGSHLAEAAEVEVQRESDHALDLAQAAAAVLLEALQVHLRVRRP